MPNITVAIVNGKHYFEGCDEAAARIACRIHKIEIATLEVKVMAKLQAYGLADTKPATEFAPGDVRLFNYGQRATVKAVRRASSRFLEFEYENGSTQRFRDDVRLAWAAPA